MKISNKLMKKIERLGERYCSEYLDWDKKLLENNWWEALKFFFRHSFMRGRSVELSMEYYWFTIEALKDKFSISNEDIGWVLSKA